MPGYVTASGPVRRKGFPPSHGRTPVLHYSDHRVPGRLKPRALFVAGMANAPTLITGNTLVSTVVPAHARTEAYTWLGVTVFAGIAGDSPIGGVLTDHANAAAYGCASVIAGTIAAGVATTGQHARIRPA